MSVSEEFVRADLLVSEGEERILRLCAHLDRAAERGSYDAQLSLQVLATMRESLNLMVRHRDHVRREASSEVRRDAERGPSTHGPSQSRPGS